MNLAALAQTHAERYGSRVLAVVNGEQVTYILDTTGARVLVVDEEHVDHGVWDREAVGYLVQR